MEQRPPKLEILHSFMLWYQGKYGAAPSIRTVLHYCPLWTTPGGVRAAIVRLAADRKAEMRETAVPGSVGTIQRRWWALDTCDDADERV